MQRQGKGVVASLIVASLVAGGTVMGMRGMDRAKAGVPTEVGQGAVQGTPVLAKDALFTSPVNGSETFMVTGQPFDRAVRVTLATKGADTNSVQLLAPTSGPVAAGDGLVASLAIR